MAASFRGLQAPASLEVTFHTLRQLEAEWHERKSDVWGLPTPFRALNRLTGGIHSGLTILGARTSHGKSAAVMNIVFNLAHLLIDEWLEQEPVEAQPPGTVLVFSPEMTAVALMERYATSRSGVALNDIRRGKATAEQREKWLFWAESMAVLAPVMQLHAGCRYSFEEIIEAIEEALEPGQPPVRLVVIDYIQRIRRGTLAAGSDVQQLSHMMDGLQHLAATRNLPVLVASQLNRSIERDHQTGSQVERPPELSDLKGSGALEEDADVVMLLWRPPEPQRRMGEVGAPQRAVMYVKKNRHGEVGECELLFWPQIVTFADRPRLGAQVEGKSADAGNTPDAG